MFGLPETPWMLESSSKAFFFMSGREVPSVHGGLKDLEEFDGENQGCVRRDGTGSALGTVGELVRNVELVLGALGHQLETLGPTRNDLIETEDGRLVAIV